MHVPIPPNSPPIQAATEHWAEFRALYGRSLLVIHLNIAVYIYMFIGLPWWLSGKESTCQCRRLGFDSWVWKIPWRRKWQPTLVFLPRKSHRHRSLVGTPTIHGVAEELDLTQQLSNNTYEEVSIFKCFLRKINVTCLGCSLKHFRTSNFPFRYSLTIRGR